MTEYIVLKRHSSSEQELWNYGLTVEARSAKAAIQSACLNERDGGEFVAVPLRSWKPVTVKVETKTALRFSS